MSNEPSMEDILSSIKRIIAEESEGVVTTRAPRRPARRPREVEEDEVLELSEPAPAEDAAVQAGATPVEAREAAPEPLPQGILSERAYAATRGSIEALSKLVVKPEVPGSDTLEGLVREMLKPMLRDWLDANLPGIVERTVQREIARITGRE